MQVYICAMIIVKFDSLHVYIYMCVHTCVHASACSCAYASHLWFPVHGLDLNAVVAQQLPWGTDSWHCGRGWWQTHWAFYFALACIDVEANFVGECDIWR